MATQAAEAVPNVQRFENSATSKRQIAHAALLMALIALGVLVAALSFLISRNENAWWTVPLPALATYVVLLIGILFKDQDNPVAKLLSTAMEAVVRRVWLAVMIAVLMTTAAAAAGYHLIRTAERPDGELRFLVYEGANIEGHRQAGLTIEVEHLSSSTQTASAVTDERGMAAVPISIGDFVTVRIVRADGRIYVLNHHKTVSESDLADPSAVDISQVAADQWFTRRDFVNLGEQVGVLTVDPALLRWNARSRTRIVGDPATMTPLAPLALPPAEIIVAREPFTTGFSPALRQPRWVASRVFAGGVIPRREPATNRPDPLLPEEMQVSASDYANNIFDRAHLVRRNDLAPQFRGTEERDYLTAITPQTNITNQRLWRDLEDYTAERKTPTNEVYLLRGPAFVSGSSGQITLSVLGASRLPVPNYYFQIAMIVEPGRSPLIECHLVPNTNQAGLVARGETPQRFRTTLREIEAATGLPFFTQLQGAARPCGPV